MSGLPERALETQVSWHLSRINQRLSVSGKTKLTDDGHLVIDAPDAGTYVFTIFKSATMPRISKHIRIDEDTETIDVALPASGRLVGSVRDRKGEPVAKLRVQIGQQMTKTDAEGQFQMPSAPAGTHLVWLFLERSSYRYGTAEIIANQDTRVDIVLRGGSEIRARLLLDGTPVARMGGTVNVLHGTTNKVIASGWPHSDGRIHVRHLERGSYGLEIRANNAPSTRRKVDLGIEQELDLGDVALRTYTPIPVRLVLPEGIQIKDVQLIGMLDGIDPTKMRDFPRGRLAEASDGSMQLTGLPPGTFRFQARAKGCQPLEFEVTQPHTSKEPFEIRLEAE